MNEQIATFLFSIAGAVIMLLLGGNAYFLKRWIDSTDALTSSVNDLKTTVALLQTNQGNSDKVCSTTHQIIDTRLKNHSDKIQEHSEAIIDLQVAISRQPAKT